MIMRIEAWFSCDDCGMEFTVAIDPAKICSGGWSMMLVAEDSIRGGEGYDDGDETRGHSRGSGCVTAEGRHYCDACTKRMDIHG